MHVSNELLKNKLISLFLVRIWILRKAYNSPYTAARTAVFEAVNLSGMIWAQWFLLAEWNLVSAEHSFVLFLSLRTFCFSKSFSNTKDKFCPKNISVCQKFWIRSLKVWREKKKNVYPNGSKIKGMSGGGKKHPRYYMGNSIFKSNCCIGTWYASLLALDRFTMERHKLNSFSCGFEAKSVWLLQPLNGV